MPKRDRSYTSPEQCRIGALIEGWVCAVMLAGIVLGAVLSSGLWAVRR